MKQIIFKFIVVFIGANLYSQVPTRLNKVTLTIKHSMRIPYNNVVVDFKALTKREVEVNVKSKPLASDEKWNYSKIDTTFYIERKEYSKITDSIMNIDHQKIANKVGGLSIDGYICNLQFGGINDFIVYSINSPDKELMEFHNLCKYILEFVGLDPYNIMEKPTTEEEEKTRLKFQEQSNKDWEKTKQKLLKNK